ncbi:MAG: Gfo/Idh/MocA family oxidoreductase [Bacteroidia bacterium]|nr:Gfo/Idh/MocA family oxidoreductase [Bacteroidia bacterium]
MKAPIRVGIVGLGYMGRLHLRRALESPRAQVTALYDPAPDSVKELRMQSLPVVESYEQLLERVEAVIIASPTSTHGVYAAAALRAQKHVFIEKPVTATAEELEMLLRLQEEVGVVTMVGHVERFNPAFQALWPFRSEFSQYVFERIAPWTPRGSDASVILDLLIHDLDLFWALTEGRVADIRLAAYRTLTRQADTVHLWIDLVDGRGASFLVSRTAPHKRRRLVANGPTLWCEGDFLQRTAQGWRLQGEQYIPLALEIPSMDALAAELEHFLSSIQEGRATSLSLEHVHSVMSWAWQVEALAEHRLLFAPQ